MPDILHSLSKFDLGYLRIVAGLWGLELESNDSTRAAEELAGSLLEPKLVAEITASLPAEANTALTTLGSAGGRLPWAAFTRQFGDVREMGAGRRDREKPQFKPASAAEVLFYRALLARAFFDTSSGPQEFAYIPDDLLALLQMKRGKQLDRVASPTEAFGRGATPGERAYLLPANDHILDDATTVLAALRIGRVVQTDPVLLGLLDAAKLLKKDVPQAEKVKAFLEAPRTEALQMLVKSWRTSGTFNELRLIPGLLFEGEWKNQPLVAREFILNLLDAIPEDKWWNINTLISDIKKKVPDFQRPSGDYDSWFIRREADGQYLRGFAYWDQVDGALIRFFIMTILYGLGLVELASPGEGKEITAFHLTHGRPISSIENGTIKVSSNGRILASSSVPRAARYQLVRFCEGDQEISGEYRYQLTPASLTRAKEQGLKVEHLLALLSKHAAGGVPPVLVKALKRWEINGAEARAEVQVVLRVSRPEVLEELRRSKAARFLGEPLGPTAVVIKTGAQSKVMAALAEIGLLAEDDTTNGKEI